MSVSVVEGVEVLFSLLADPLQSLYLYFQSLLLYGSHLVLLLFPYFLLPWLFSMEDLVLLIDFNNFLLLVFKLILEFLIVVLPMFQLLLQLLNLMFEFHTVPEIIFRANFVLSWLFSQHINTLQQSDLLVLIISLYKCKLFPFFGVELLVVCGLIKELLSNFDYFSLNELFLFSDVLVVSFLSLDKLVFQLYWGFKLFGEWEGKGD